MFAWFGLKPKVIVTDSGTCFTSSEFVEFAECNKIHHVQLEHITHLAMTWQKSCPNIEVWNEKAVI